jgi:hypothetical protein
LPLTVLFSSDAVPPPIWMPPPNPVTSPTALLWAIVER